MLAMFIYKPKRQPLFLTKEKKKVGIKQAGKVNLSG